MGIDMQPLSIGQEPQAPPSEVRRMRAYAGVYGGGCAASALRATSSGVDARTTSLCGDVRWAVRIRRISRRHTGLRLP